MNAQATDRPPRTDMLTGLFRDRESAEEAYETLRTRGYGEQDVNILMTDDTRKRWYPGDKSDTALGAQAGTKAMAGAGVGGRSAPRSGPSQRCSRRPRRSPFRESDCSPQALSRRRWWAPELAA